MSNPDFSVTGIPPEFTVTKDHLMSGQLDGAARISPSHRTHALRADGKPEAGMTSVCDISLHYWESAQALPLPADVTCRQCRVLLPRYLEEHPPAPVPSPPVSLRAALKAENAILKAALDAGASEILSLANDRNLWQEEAETWRAVSAVLLLRLSGTGLPVATADLTALESALVHGRSVAATIRDDYPDHVMAVSVQLLPLNSGQGQSV